MKSDIQIAQEADNAPNQRSSSNKLGITERMTSNYTENTKPRLSDELIERSKRSAGWKADSCDSNQSNAGWRGKNND